MKSNTKRLAPLAGLLVCSGLLVTMSGCVYGGRHSPATAQVTLRSPGPSLIVIEDDYDYYPGYEIYYSRNRHEYVYRDGTSWVRRNQPAGISVDVLLASPAVRVDFRDAPERHHATVVRSYPRNWKGPDSKPDNKDEKKKDHKDNGKNN
jgi:hypothetical protein